MTWGNHIGKQRYVMLAILLPSHRDDRLIGTGALSATHAKCINTHSSMGDCTVRPLSLPFIAWMQRNLSQIPPRKQ